MTLRCISEVVFPPGFESELAQFGALERNSALEWEIFHGCLISLAAINFNSTKWREKPLLNTVIWLRSEYLPLITLDYSSQNMQLCQAIGNSNERLDAKDERNQDEMPKLTFLPHSSSEWDAFRGSQSMRLLLKPNQLDSRVSLSIWKKAWNRFELFFSTRPHEVDGICLWNRTRFFSSSSQRQSVHRPKTLWIFSLDASRAMRFTYQKECATK